MTVAGLKSPLMWYCSWCLLLYHIQEPYQVMRLCKHIQLWTLIHVHLLQLLLPLTILHYASQAQFILVPAFWLNMSWCFITVLPLLPYKVSKGVLFRKSFRVLWLLVDCALGTYFPTGSGPVKPCLKWHWLAICALLNLFGILKLMTLYRALWAESTGICMSIICQAEYGIKDSLVHFVQLHCNLLLMCCSKLKFD